MTYVPVGDNKAEDSKEEEEGSGHMLHISVSEYLLHMFLGLHSYLLLHCGFQKEDGLLKMSSD